MSLRVSILRPHRRSQRLVRRRARGAAMVEAVIVIVFLVFFWQLCWLVLRHYQAKQYASQAARQGVWQYAMRNSCEGDPPDISGGSAANQDNPPDRDQLNPPPDTGAGTGNSGDLDSGKSAGDDFIDDMATKGRIATYTVERPYSTSISPGVVSVSSQIKVECNPENGDFGSMVSSLVGSLWSAQDK